MRSLSMALRPRTEVATYLLLILYFATLSANAQATQSAKTAVALIPPLLASSVNVDLRMTALPPVSADANKTRFDLAVKLNGNTRTAEVDIWYFNNDKFFADILIKAATYRCDLRVPGILISRDAGRWLSLLMRDEFRVLLQQLEQLLASETSSRIYPRTSSKQLHPCTYTSGIGLMDLTIFSIAVSPNGKWLATGDYGGTLRIWDLDARTLIRVSPGSSTKDLQGSGPRVFTTIRPN